RRSRDHFAADHRDPRSRKRLAKSRYDKREGSWQDHFVKEHFLVGTHGFSRADPQSIDRSHTGPRIKNHREGRGVKYQRDRRRVAETKPENEDRNPGQRRDRHENAHQRNEKPLDTAKASHENTNGHTY